jgi:hypothetical protein
MLAELASSTVVAGVIALIRLFPIGDVGRQR